MQMCLLKKLFFVSLLLTVLQAIDIFNDFMDKPLRPLQAKQQNYKNTKYMF